MERLPYTHFLSVPLLQCKDALEQFKSAALRDDGEHLTPAMFVPACKVSVGSTPAAPPRWVLTSVPVLLCVGIQAHLTLLMLKLPSASRVRLAADTLKKVTPQLQAMLAASSKGSRAAKLQLKGLACMVCVRVACSVKLVLHG